MHTKLALGGAVLAATALLVSAPVAVEAAGQITGKQIKNNSVAGKDIKDGTLTGADVVEGSLGQVPSAAKADTATNATSATTATRAGTADGLSVAPGGTVMSGVFSAAASNSAGEGDYLGFAITYPRALATPVPDANIIDTAATPDATRCPGPGRAARGYLCLYNEITYGVDGGYGYSDDSDVLVNGTSVGVVGYFPVTGDTPYAGGVWTVNAP